jgi:endonuclease/exonuclease/phosphatase family metal-dependent hydrolase
MPLQMDDERALVPGLLMLFLILILFGAAFGCTGHLGLVGLDDPHPLDEVRLSDDPRLAHLGEALGGKQGLLARDLFTELPLKAGPHPGALLRAFSSDNPDAHPLAQSLVVRSYNVGLLDISLFGSGLRILEGPELKARRGVLFERVFSGNVDAVLLQEVWADDDIQKALSAGADAGFSCHTFTEEGGKTGLITCLHKRGLMGRETQGWAQEFEGPAADVISYAGDVVRSMAWVDFSWAGVGKMRIYNLHLSPLFDGRFLRMYQMRAVGLHAKSQTEKRLTLLGGDLNASPFYAQNGWEDGEGQSQWGWWEAAVAYPLGLFYGGFSDLMIRGRPLEESDDEVSHAKALIHHFDNSLNEAYGDESQCPALNRAGLTATDCNALHFAQYAGKEPPARLDHLWAADPTGRIRVERSRLIFTEREVDVGGKSMELSDHYGVEAELWIAPESFGVEETNRLSPADDQAMHFSAPTSAR